MDRMTAIWNTHPSVVSIYGTTKATDSNGDIVNLDESLIKTELARLQAEYDSQEYARNRKEEYDALNQLEMQYDDEVNSTTTWKNAIEAIKTKYPKG